MTKAKPFLSFTDRAKSDIRQCRLFLERRYGGQPARRVREIYTAARLIPDAPKLYPADAVHPASGLELRRKNVGQFVIIYAYLEPTPSLPRGKVSIRAVRHGAREDVLFHVEESRAASGSPFPRLRTGYHVSVP
jgi:plasmid stabilization system protein ParE